jgi:NAD-dependent deacetylase
MIAARGTGSRRYRRQGSEDDRHSRHRRPDRRGHFRGAGLRPFRGPAGCGKGTGSRMSARPRRWSGTRALVLDFYDAAPRGAGDGRAQCRAPGAGAARSPSGPASFSSSPRMSTICTNGPAQADAARAWRAAVGLVRGVRRTRAFGGTMTTGRGVRLRRGGHAPARHRLLRRDALRNGADRAALMRADLFVSIGTSGAVYPAAGFVQHRAPCQRRDARAQPGAVGGELFFDETRLGPAGELVPAWVDEVLAGQA